MKCIRCEEDKHNNNFLDDSELPDVCRACLTDSEVQNYSLSDISKAMLHLTSKERKKILVDVMRDHQRKRRIQHV